ncbi:MAG: hypothetical protein GC129_03985 [Proteobacteria bacterium]|nr:hypothetical protein [Pseudomonadota bacterium]
MSRTWMEFVMLSLALTALTAWALNGHADEEVRVQLPGGKLVQVMDKPSQRWWESPDLQGYSRFYYKPETGTYHVYDAPKGWPSPARWGSEGVEESASAGPDFIRWNEQRTVSSCPPGMPSYGVGTACR